MRKPPLERAADGEMAQARAVWNGLPRANRTGNSVGATEKQLREQRQHMIVCAERARKRQAGWHRKRGLRLLSQHFQVGTGVFFVRSADRHCRPPAEYKEETLP
ncbi:hypothetical protein BHK98_05250 [Hornefia porci]|uniref:Uncharacterized protein n=1 Tax=Hornefia porci TaxID=2652292 RepID=A0A1Q9JH75_9FIRM|nr:hypothetical protein BHK98_05250 [Hornefia porci]